MFWIIFSFIIALLASMLLTIAVRGAALHWGVVDRPDGQRKLHCGAVPLWGGVAIYLAMLMGLWAASFGTYGIGAEFDNLVRAVAVAAGFVCCIGCIDDAFHLPARAKLSLQICSILPIVLVGYYVESAVVFGYRIELGYFGIPLTVLWLLGCINALNLIDGMDGLASLVGLSTAAMMGVIAASEGHAHVAVIALVMSGALAGFFAHNRPPARIFLGDSGSMVIGLAVGVLGMQGTLKTSATLSITAPVVVMTLPMWDVVLAVVRRKLTGRRFDAPDREHIHHRLLDRGLSQWQVLCIFGALCLTTGAAATAATIFRKDALAWITSLTLIVVMIRMKLFGYHEFSLLHRAMLGQWAALRQAFRRVRGASDLKRIASADEDSLLQAWDSLIQEMQCKGIRRLDWRFANGPIEGRRRWVDPLVDNDRACRWSVSASVQKLDGRSCEVRADGFEKPSNQRDVEFLTGLLRSFGTQVFELVEETEVLPLMEDIRIVSVKPQPPRRKAA
jgi:UDP-GlcNAc:undecaprenyl-phosphate/decaprenyl-phosphate GlcNAc-1-phosphate transferase